MNGFGSGNSGQLTFIDLLSIMSFMIGVLNYNENLTQSDKQDIMKELEHNAGNLLDKINGHLQEQDKKLDKILSVLESLK